MVDRPQHRVDAADVEQRVLLPREGGLGEILGRGRGAHCDGDIVPGRAAGQPVAAGAQFAVGGPDAGGEVRRERRVGDPAPYLAARLGERPQVLDIQGVERGVDAFTEFAREEVAVCPGRDRKPAGDIHAGGGEMRDHLAERGVLPPDGFEIGESDRLEWRDIPGHGGSQPRPPGDPERLSQAN